MPCYKPLTAYQCVNGEIVFAELARYDIYRTLTLPCGQCTGCRLERSRQWAMRCTHEAALHDQNCFVTLTYDDEHMPNRNSLTHRDWQLFMKRLRQHIAPTQARFYMCGEYGEQTWRPHFHACIFGYDFPDKTHWSTSETGEHNYRSKTLEKLWTYGNSLIGRVTFESAAYVARYCMKKITGNMAEEHYKRYDMLGEYQLEPEYNKSSLKPGIGSDWYKKYKTDVHTYDYVIINGKECRPPKYYDKLLSRELPDRLEELKEQRIQRAKARSADNTDERLIVKERVQLARINNLQRNKQ